MILSDKAVKWMAVDVIICIICFILWVSSDDGGDVYEMLTMISGLALLVIPYVTMSKEEREKGREEGCYCYRGRKQHILVLR